MSMGGLYGAGKHNALRHLPDTNKPRSLFFEVGTSVSLVQERIRANNLSFPLIIKPDLGERGKGVEKLHDMRQLERTLPTHTSNFLIQEFLDQPFEAGVFYIRFPQEERGRITSVVVKGFLEITGDGKHSVKELALQNKRALLVWDKMKHSLSIPESKVLERGEKVALEPIGNHSRGTAFNDGNHLISKALTDEIERLARHVPDFYYGRFDLRTQCEEDLKRGKGLQVMELNGVNAEPAHIYQEGASLLVGMATLVRHWHWAFQIGMRNKKNHPPVKFYEALVVYRSWRSIKTEKWSVTPASDMPKPD